MLNKKIKFVFRLNRGQSLLELIVAIGIILACTIATLTLVITSIQAGRKGSDKIIATNLAREGIEIVRNIRDSNWISAASGIGSPVPSWDSGLVNGTDPTAIPIIDDTNTSKLDFTPNGWGNNCGYTLDCSRIYKYQNNYIQTKEPLDSWEKTTFYRLLYLNPICRYDNLSVPNDPNNGNEQIFSKESSGNCATEFGANYDKVGVRVISEVRWPNSNGKNKVILEDRLYNWRAL